MTTLTTEEVEGNLASWLSRALKGEDIRIVERATGKIVALRPIETESEDYAFTEYGLTKEEWDRSYEKTIKRIEKERAEGKLKRIA